MIVEESAPKYYTLMTPAEYLSWERKETTKHEYVSGTIVSMAGASPKHNLILSHIISATDSFLKGKPCNIYPSDLRSYVKSKESYFYPDASIVCGELELSDDIKDTVKNPAVIFEILSPSTEDYDFGKKFFYYNMQIESLRQYITIDSTKMFIRISRKQPNDARKFEEYTQNSESLWINTIEFSIPLHDIYEGIFM
ncbi:MAG: Uma2 family endonuclease [Agriterribacter sp.]